MLYYAALQRPTAVALAFFELLTFNFELQLLVLENKKRGSQLRPLLFVRTPAISYLWPECVIRARKSRRLSATVEPANSARSAGLHLLIVMLMAAAHLSMPSALG